jgi:hypothetical protein
VNVLEAFVVGAVSSPRAFLDAKLALRPAEVSGPSSSESAVVGIWGVGLPSLSDRRPQPTPRTFFDAKFAKSDMGTRGRKSKTNPCGIAGGPVRNC